MTFTDVGVAAGNHLPGAQLLVLDGVSAGFIHRGAGGDGRLNFCTAAAAASYGHLKRPPACRRTGPPKIYRVNPSALDTQPLHSEKFAQSVAEPKESLRRPDLSIADWRAIVDAWIIIVVYTIFLCEKLRLPLSSDSKVLLTWPNTGTAQAIELRNGDWPSKGENLLPRVPRSPAPDHDPNFLWLRRHSIQTGNKSFGQFSKHGRGVAGKGNFHAVNRQ